MKKKLCLLLALLLVISVPLTACSGNDKPADQPAEQTPGEETPDPDVKYILNLGITSFPTNTNPFSQRMQQDHDGLRMYETLVNHNAETLEFVGQLAESWTVSEDGLEWTMKLRENVTWHDGEKFDAEDVYFTYKTIVDSKGNDAAAFTRKAEVKYIEKVEKTGDYEVKLTTSIPVANFLIETLGVVYIVPEHIWGSMETQELLDYLNETPVGTSPWKIVGEFNPQNTEFEYEIYDGYYGKMPEIDGLLYIMFENKDTMFQAFKAGNIDMFSPTGTQVTELEGAEGITVLTNLKPKLTEIGINVWDPEKTPIEGQTENPGNIILRREKNVRRAIDYALDKQKLVDDVLKGAGAAGSTIVPTSAGKWHLDIPHDYNPEKAIELLEEAGFTSFETVDIEGREVQVRTNDAGEKLLFRFALLTDGYAWHYRDSMPYIVNNLEAVGIGLLIEPMEGSMLGATMKLDSETWCNFDMYIWGWTPGYDPNYILTVLTTEQLGNRQEVMYSNPEYDALVEKQIQQVVDEERLVTVHAAQQMIFDEACYIPLYYQGYYDAYNSDKWEGIIQFGGEGTIFNSDCYKSIRPK